VVVSRSLERSRNKPSHNDRHGPAAIDAADSRHVLINVNILVDCHSHGPYSSCLDYTTRNLPSSFGSHVTIVIAPQYLLPIYVSYYRHLFERSCFLVLVPPEVILPHSGFLLRIFQGRLSMSYSLANAASRSSCILCRF